MLAQDTVTLRVQGNDSSAAVHLLVSNEAGAGAVTIQFIDDSGKPLPLQHGSAAPGDSYRVSLPAFSVTPVDLNVTMTHSAVDGHVVIQPKHGAAVIAAFVTARSPAIAWLWLPIAGSLVALVLVWFASRGAPSFDHQLGVATDWKFTDSWASNVTAVSAVTGTVLGLSGFLDDVLHDVVVTRFIGLDALFLALVAGAPLLFSTFTKRVGEDRVGTVAGFLLACWATLTAAFGEIIVLAVMLYMARGGAGMWLIALMLFGAAGVLVVYGWRSISDTVTHKRSFKGRGSAAEALPSEYAKKHPEEARLSLL